MEQQSRPRANFGISLEVALAWLAALAVIIVIAETVYPRVTCIGMTDGCYLPPSEAAFLALFYVVPVSFVAAVISGVALLGTTRLFSSSVIAGSVAAAIPVLPLAIGYAWLTR